MKPTLGALIALLLAACASVAPYQPLSGGVGYSEQRLEDNRYRVSFAGNERTPRDTVDSYMLYRAAELTLASQYDYFIVESRDTQAQTQQSPVGFSFGVGAFGSHSVSGVGVGTDNGGVQPEYNASAVIVMYRGTKPQADPRAYDARQVQANLGAQVMRPKTGS